MAGKGVQYPGIFRFANLRYLVPEPGALVLLALGAVGLVGRRRRADQ